MTGESTPGPHGRKPRSGGWRRWLAVLLLLNLVLLILVRQGRVRSRTATPDALAASSAVHEIVGGPFAPYPMSFPKMATGILIFESHPELAVKPAQARQLLPVLKNLDRDWTILKTAELAMRPLFTQAQEQYIWEHKAEFETVVMKPPGRKLGDAQLGTAGGMAIDKALQLLRTAARGVDRRAQPKRRAYSQVTITIYDMTQGIVVMHDMEPLRVRGPQAVALSKILAPTPVAEHGLHKWVSRMKSLLSPAQMHYIVTHMAEITELRGRIFTFHNIWQSFFVKDPLLARTIALLRRRARQPGK